MNNPFSFVNTIDVAQLRALAPRELKDLEEVTLVLSEHGFYSVPVVVVFPLERYEELIQAQEKLRLMISQFSLLLGMDELAQQARGALLRESSTPEDNGGSQGIP